jgi:hypothetical protein
MNEQIAIYMAFLIEEMRRDAAVLNTPWVCYTAIPLCLYGIYMGLKWYLLLAPITVPLTVVFSKQATKVLPWIKNN